MANIKLYTRILVATIIVNSSTATDTRFPNYDPKNEALVNIAERAPVAYCLVRIEKNKKLVASAQEPSLPSDPKEYQYTPINTADWFKEQRANLKLIVKAEDDGKKSAGQKISKNLTAAQLQNTVMTDQIHQTLKFVNPDKTIYTPKYTSQAGEGWGVAVDCYMGNSDYKVKRQVGLVNCPPTATNFIMFNKRMVSDGDDGKQKVIWLEDRAGVPLADFANGGDRFFIGSLSDYADGFLEAQHEKCTLMIKSSVFIAAVTWILGFALVFGWY